MRSLTALSISLNRYWSQCEKQGITPKAPTLSSLPTLLTVTYLDLSTIYNA
ncbi:MAG: hypothetical protein ACQESR_27405 [Planctomycetota bacterium]